MSERKVKMMAEALKRCEPYVKDEWESFSSKVAKEIYSEGLKKVECGRIAFPDRALSRFHEAWEGEVDTYLVLIKHPSVDDRQ